MEHSPSLRGSRIDLSNRISPLSKESLDTEFLINKGANHCIREEQLSFLRIISNRENGMYPSM
jgi:hypothetical protein